jgi:hypothetical protein
VPPQGEEQNTLLNDRCVFASRGSSSRWLASSLLSCGATCTRSCCCRWRNIHLSSAKNLRNNPMLIFAQGPRVIQPNLKRYHPHNIKKEVFEEEKCCCLYYTIMNNTSTNWTLVFSKQINRLYQGTEHCKLIIHSIEQQYVNNLLQPAKQVSL